MSAPADLELTGLRKVFFPGTANEVAALRGIDLEVPAGQFVTIIGSNGSGKSTLLNAVAGTFPLTAGKVVLGGPRRDQAGRARAQPLHRPGLPGSARRHRALHDHRGEPRHVAAPLEPQRPALRCDQQAARGDARAALAPRHGARGAAQGRREQALRRPATGDVTAHGHHRRTQSPAARRAHGGARPQGRGDDHGPHRPRSSPSASSPRSWSRTTWSWRCATATGSS